MTRIRIDCAYDGTNFHGWARQPHLRTVQGEIEAAIGKVLHVRPENGDSPIRLVVAGRTDTGVHARGQVCHADIEEAVLARGVGHLPLDPVAALGHRLPFVLPEDIVLHRLSVAPEGFDARFSALERTYVYRICDDQECADPLVRDFVLPVHRKVDVGRLEECAALIPGLRDFGSFATPNPGGTTIREVKKAGWRHVPVEVGPDGQRIVGSGLLEFTIVADAFAHNMVRSLVGAQLVVGEGRRSVDWFREKLEHVRREGETGPIDARGLCLEHVAYPPDGQLAERAWRIRARRVLPDRD